MSVWILPSHPQRQALEVLRLRKRRRVIRRVVGGPEFGHGAVLGGGVHDGPEKFFLAHVRGAGGGDQDAAGGTGGSDAFGGTRS